MQDHITRRAQLAHTLVSCVTREPTLQLEVPEESCGRATFETSLGAPHFSVRFTVVSRASARVLLIEAHLCSDWLSEGKEECVVGMAVYMRLARGAVTTTISLLWEADTSDVCP